MADGCDCTLGYDVLEIHLRQLQADGSPNLTPGTWYESDSIIDFDVSPEIEEGKKNVLRCGGGIKNTYQGADLLTGASLKISLCCENPEVEYIINGAVGTITYDSSSPPCAVGYEEPLPSEMVNALPFEAKIYVRVVEGSDTVKYKEIHFYHCLPTFSSEKGGQEEYVTPEYTIKCTDAPSYSPAPMPVRSWAQIAAIP